MFFIDFECRKTLQNLKRITRKITRVSLLEISEKVYWWKSGRRVITLFRWGCVWSRFWVFCFRNFLLRLVSNILRVRKILRVLAP